jgi:septum formation protein
MLSTIQGTTHEVWGGFALVCHNSSLAVVESHSTEVTMIKLSPKMIKDYLASGEPLDKAGAYAIQGIGASLVERVNGSYTNVVGLNLAAVISALRRAEIVN